MYITLENAGYEPSRITVLTMYSGQRLQLARLLPKGQYPGLRVAVVDNYQGEENDIVLLSLVRSNAAGVLGFVKTQNRVLVSLSRARLGLYVFGDIDMLTQHCEHWRAVVQQVRQVERESGAQLVGTAFSLYCQKHPEHKTLLSTPEDLENCPQGIQQII